MVVNDGQFSGKYKVVKLVQLENALSFMKVIVVLFDILTITRFKQLLNAKLPIETTVSGNVKESNDVQFSNTLLPMEIIIEFEKSIDTKEVQL